MVEIKKKVSNDNVTFEVETQGYLLQMFFNDIKWFAQKYDSIGTTIDGQKITVHCPDVKTAKLVQQYELE